MENQLKSQARIEVSKLLNFFKDLFSGNFAMIIVKLWKKRKEIIKKLEELYELLS